MVFSRSVSFMDVPKFNKSIHTNCSHPHLDTSNVTKLGPDNLKSVQKLWYENQHETYIQKLFGQFNLEEIMYKSYITLGVHDADGILAGVMFLGLHPNIPAISPGEWEPWIYKLYGFNQIKSCNSLWIRLLIWSPMYYFLFLKPMVQYLFRSKVGLKFLLMMVPPGNCETDFLANLGYPVKPFGINPVDNSQYIYFMLRQTFVIPYKIRGAVLEDNDDIIPLIENYSKKLSETFGKFYIAELLSKFNDGKRKIILAEYENKIVGVLCFNDYVNYQYLSNEFDIGLYNGLKKAHAADLETFEFDVLHSYSPKDSLPMVNVEDLECFSKMFNSDEKQSEVVINIINSESDDFSLLFTTSAMYLFQDDDDFSESYVTENNIYDSFCLQMFTNLVRRQRISAVTDRSRMRSTLNLGTVERIHNPEFLGEPNAFCIEIIAVDPQHEECLLPLFECAFDCFPDKDYCVMTTVPMDVEDHFLSIFFSNVPQRYDGVSQYDLHVMHKNTILGDVSVKEIKIYHKAHIKSLLSTIPNSAYIWQQLDKAISDPDSPVYCYVILCQRTVIGVALIVEELQFRYLRTHYDLYPINYKFHRSGSQGHVECIFVSPIFSRFSQFFIQEIHRLSDFEVLFYKLRQKENNVSSRERPLNNLLNCFLPMMPLLLPEIDAESLKKQGYNIDTEVFKEHEPFALYVSTLSTCSIKIVNVTKKIVVVGGSSIAIAFLKSLVFSKNMYYNVVYKNLTMVSAQGFRTNVSEKIRNSFFQKKEFQARFLDEINLRTFVNIVIGKVTQLRRHDKILIINEEAALAYDLLFLMTGEVFPMPDNHLIRQKSLDNPRNLFIINCEDDAARSVLKLKSLHSELEMHDFKIIIYGHQLQAFITLAGLLSFGIPGELIVFVEPFPYPRSMGRWHMQNISMFNDPDIDEAVYARIENENVELYSSYYFVDWEYDYDNKRITSVKFESRHKMITIKCLAMFYYGDKDVHHDISTWIFDASLVYDGRLVIDNNYRTNDPCIFAAGTLTKYARKYSASHMNHKYFCSSEIGEHLAQTIKEMLLDEEILNKAEKKHGWNFYLNSEKNLVPKYEKPKMIYCKLPGQLYYCSVTKPGRKIPLETAITMPNYGQVLITGDTTNLDEQGFFRLHIDPNGRVETITCLSKTPIDYRNIYCLWGKHETMLNNVMIRFQMVLINDFFEYFRQPWAILLYHPKFEELQKYIDLVMKSIVENDGESIVYKIINDLKSNNWKPITKDQYNKLAEHFKTLSYAQIIEQKVLDFIEENLDQLPQVYAHPKVIVEILKGFEQSHLFR